MTTTTQKAIETLKQAIDSGMIAKANGVRYVGVEESKYGMTHVECLDGILIPVTINDRIEMVKRDYLYS